MRCEVRGDELQHGLVYVDADSEKKAKAVAARSELDFYSCEIASITSEQVRWFGIVRWCAEDVISAAEMNGITLTKAQAEKWLKKNERWFQETLIEYGNEVLASASRESFEEVCKS